MLPSLKLDDLETAINVIESKNFTRAGVKLHKHQTILSCQGLCALDVLRCSRGTNFRLSVGESSAIDGLIQASAA
jgi:hypothetical protein